MRRQIEAVQCDWLGRARDWVGDQNTCFLIKKCGGKYQENTGESCTHEAGDAAGHKGPKHDLGNNVSFARREIADDRQLYSGRHQIAETAQSVGSDHRSPFLNETLGLIIHYPQPSLIFDHRNYYVSGMIQINFQQTKYDINLQ